MGYGAISGKDLKSGCINNGAQSLDNCENGLLSSEGVGKRVHVSYSNQWIKVSDGSGASPDFHDSNSNFNMRIFLFVILGITDIRKGKIIWEIKNRVTVHYPSLIS